jgi:hypothetical protein
MITIRHLILLVCQLNSLVIMSCQAKELLWYNYELERLRPEGLKANQEYLDNIILKNNPEKTTKIFVEMLLSKETCYLPRVRYKQFDNVDRKRLYAIAADTAVYIYSRIEALEILYLLKDSTGFIYELLSKKDARRYTPQPNEIQTYQESILKLLRLKEKNKSEIEFYADIIMKDVCLQAAIPAAKKIGTPIKNKMFEIYNNTNLKRSIRGSAEFILKDITDSSDGAKYFDVLNNENEDHTLRKHILYWLGNKGNEKDIPELEKLNATTADTVLVNRIPETIRKIKARTTTH